MKKNVILITLAVLLGSCNLMIIEPVYDDRERLTGSYRIEEHSQTYNDYTRFSIYIRKSGIYDEVVIENFYHSGLAVRASVAYDKIYITRQIINGYEIEGVGTFYGNEIEFSYRVRDTFSYNVPTDFCNATAWFD